MKSKVSDYLDKLDLELRQIYADYLESQQGEKDSALESSPGYNLTLRYREDLSEIESLGFKTTWNDIQGFAHGVVRLGDLERIVTHPNVLSLEYGSEPDLDLDHSAPDIKARSDTQANIGTNGLWHIDPSSGNLAASSLALGNNVIVGVIDTGIDIEHPVFMKSLSPIYETRILRIWDQGLDPNPPSEVGPNPSLLLVTPPAVRHTYGVEFNNTMINNYLNNNVPPTFRHKDCVGHGTHVAATAAGDGNPGEGASLFGFAPSDFEFVGIAPKADIIAVKLLDVKKDIKDTAGNSVSLTTRFRDAVTYILKVAENMVKPSVINCSFGSSIGPHDGLTDDEQFLDGLFDSSSTYYQGNILVKSAGNSGGRRQHAKITIPASGEIVVPFVLFNTRGAHTNRYKECSWQDDTRDLYVDMWYREVTAPDDVSVAVKVPTDAAFSSEVLSGQLTKRFDGNKRRTILHEAKPAVTRPAPPGPSISVQRNRILLKVEPNRGVSPPEHKTGIYEIKIKGPQGTVLHAWAYQVNRRLGIRVGAFTTLSADKTTGSTTLDVVDTTGFSVSDSISIRLNNGTQHNTTINSLTAGAPGVLNVTVGLPSPADSGSTVVVPLTSGIDVDDKFLIGSDGGANNIITVAAYDDKNGNIADTNYANITSFSSRGPLADYSGLGPYADKPEIAAPGFYIKAAKSQYKDGVVLGLAELFGNRFINMSGTSISAPHITGAIALLLEKKSDLTVDQVKAIFSNNVNVRAGTNPIPASGADYQHAYGGGMVDTKKSFDAVP